MKNNQFILMLLILMGLSVSGPAPAALAKADRKPPRQGEEFGNPRMPNNTADHSKFKELQQEFKSGPEVTRACLSCHTEAARQVQKTIHWTWLASGDQTEAKLGKAGNVVNNFCINLSSNEPRCTSCHAGYGWKDKTFDFTAEEKVDCLVCHEQTGQYVKFPAGAGNPVSEPTKMGEKTFNPPEWNKVAQSVGMPTRRNCGTCHFYGGGGEGVKHGDLDASMLRPEKALDVHMDANDLNFNCTRCHSSEQHVISGRSYKLSELTDRRSVLDDDQIKRITCFSCHSETPHKTGSKANDHTSKVACQTCHIPAFARKNSTKMYWDWSTAGKRDENGKPIVEAKEGRPTYDGMKGNFRWEKNVIPEYRWYNGKMNYLTLVDKVDPTRVPIRLNQAIGSYDDPNSRIYPFKVHRGKQPFDSGNNTFVAPHLFGKDDAAYWKTYDWIKATRAGMDYAGLPFSGEMSFVETEYLFQTTHMVAPKEQTLSCTECHKKGGRLEGLTGFYMPGRDKSSALDFIGWASIFAATVGVTGHGTLRFMRRKK
jgi:octaheme c-type cytochrome (tetrathionate reductase family)